MSTLSTNKGYELQDTGENAGTWGQVVNANVTGTIDTNLGGVTSKTLSNSDIELTDEEAKAPLLRLNGTLSADCTVTTPAQGFLLIENLTSGFTTNITNGTGDFVQILQNRRYLAFSPLLQGNDIILVSSVSATIYQEGSIPIGTAMLFAQSAVPTGWTLSAAINDYGLMVGATGNVTAGSVAWSTIFAQIVTGDATITKSTMPAHTHTLTQRAAGGNPAGNYGHWNSRTSVTASNVSLTLADEGDDGSHSHAIDLRVHNVTVVAGTRDV